MCSADREVRSSSQRQEGTQLYPAGQSRTYSGPEVGSAWLKHNVGLVGEEARERWT